MTTTDDDDEYGDDEDGVRASVDLRTAECLVARKLYGVLSRGVKLAGSTGAGVNTGIHRHACRKRLFESAVHRPDMWRGDHCVHRATPPAPAPALGRQSHTFFCACASPALSGLSNPR